MPNRWPASAYASLMVALYVTAPSLVELTLHDHVRVDRVVGAGVERHGDLLRPGTTSLYLTEGTYVFRTTRDARVRLSDDGSVRVAAVQNPDDKDPWPEPPSQGQGPLPSTSGDTPPDRVPTLTVHR